MRDNFKIFNTPEALAQVFSGELMESINKSAGNFFIAVSGGSTPGVLFKQLSMEPFKSSIDWGKVHFFWCDERCVLPDDPESNYGNAHKDLFSKISIPGENIHRVLGEVNPNEEVVRYSNEIEKFVVPSNNSLPRFDHILLGMGEDGHTASIFAGKNLLFVYSNIAGVAKHPVSGQKRISLTADIISNASKISFLVTGKSKAKTLSEIFNNIPSSKDYPAAIIQDTSDNVEWLIDKEAAFYL